ncbi:MAG TPA: zinc-ribbon domain-containing protein, partial [Candidatus Limnocylindria bacterium]|nr:zinc-ribbon domain-containing protein [Candidatus Limnocylindria bacterium]
MEHDDRGRRDWPDDDTADAPTDPSEPRDPSLTEGEAIPSDAAVISQEEGAAPAEIESWPSQDATAQPGGFRRDSSELDASAPDASPAWPAEPPLADSGSVEAWPARSAEADATASDEPPPSEVEAYPAAPAPEPEVTDAATAPAAAHAVPAAETVTGESTQCPRCGTENRPGLAFCRECGQRLVAAGVSSTIERPGTPEGTQACPRCGTHNRAGVAFCQNCGANLRGTAPGYVPPSVAEEEGVAVERERRGAVLGPVVLLIGLVGLITGYLLPFAYGSGSLFDRAFGSGGYGIGFWDGYPEVGAALADQAYFGLAAPVLLLGLLVLALAVAGFMRAAPGMLQTVGLVVALLWSVGLVLLFLVVELASNWDGDLVGLLRLLTPAGIIFFLTGLII